MSELISIIVPIYNTEKYLPRCIESLLNQTYCNIEIILINDGSKDRTADICDEYAKKDKRIKILHKENEGVAAARNDGINMSKGQYITFVDSDDFISFDYCENMLRAIIKNNVEIAICKLHSFIENEEMMLENVEYKEERFETEELITNYIKVGGFYDCMGAKVFSSRLFKDIRFPVGRVYEDSSTVYKIYSEATSAVVLNQEYYYYLRQREGSITTSNYDEKKQNDDYLLVTEKYKFLKGKFPQMKDLIEALYIKNIMTVIQTSYLANNENLINSRFFMELDKELRDLIDKVDKNALCKALNYYRNACLYLYLQNKEVYKKNIKELYLTRYMTNNN